MFNIISYISKTICSLNTYIFSCVTKFFTPSTISKATQTLEITKVSSLDKNEQIAKGLNAVLEQLVNMQPKLDFLVQYINLVYVQKEKPTLDSKKTFAEYLVELLDKHDEVGDKFDVLTNLLEKTEIAGHVVNAITNL
jgi:hypothetical protein